jgi:hypothetical protein
MWEDRNLDPVHFPPMASKGAFDFVNPMDVLRNCHIIPSFRRGRVHLDGLEMHGTGVVILSVGMSICSSSFSFC